MTSSSSSTSMLSTSTSSNSLKPFISRSSIRINLSSSSKNISSNNSSSNLIYRVIPLSDTASNGTSLCKVTLFNLHCFMIPYFDCFIRIECLCYGRCGSIDLVLRCSFLSTTKSLSYRCWPGRKAVIISYCHLNGCSGSLTDFSFFFYGYPPHRLYSLIHYLISIIPSPKSGSYSSILRNSI